MTWKSFLKLTEIQTKVASMIPYILGSLYAYYRFQAFNWINGGLMLLSLLCVDMATTTINNYIDFKKANKKHGFGYESHNAIVRDNIKEPVVIATISGLLSIAILTGFFLFLRTSPVVLMLGAVSFAIGILYSFGPFPISRTPFGEVFSGLIMGFFIPLITVIIHLPENTLLSVSLITGQLIVRADLLELVLIFLVSFPAIVGIANIMLANNICDIEEDLVNCRYTLPIYIGQKAALATFRFLYLIAYLSILVLVTLRVLPLFSLLTLLTLIPVFKHINLFTQKQSKQHTFVLAVRNFVLINLAHAMTLAFDLTVRFLLERFFN